MAHKANVLFALVACVLLVTPAAAAAGPRSCERDARRLPLDYVTGDTDLTMEGRVPCWQAAWSADFMLNLPVVYRKPGQRITYRYRMRAPAWERLWRCRRSPFYEEDFPVVFARVSCKTKGGTMRFIAYSTVVPDEDA